MRRMASILSIAGSQFLFGCADFYYSLLDPVVSVPPDKVVLFGRRDDGILGGSSALLLPADRADGAEKRSEREVEKDLQRFNILTQFVSYEVLPKQDYVFYEFVVTNEKSIRCLDLHLKVPKDASAVYFGKLNFHLEPQGFGEADRVKLTVEDEYDQAVGEFRKVNPAFKGRVVKALFQHPTLAAGDKVECTWKFRPPNPLEILFKPMLVMP